MVLSANLFSYPSIILKEILGRYNISYFIFIRDSN